MNDMETNTELYKKLYWRDVRVFVTGWLPLVRKDGDELW